MGNIKIGEILIQDVSCYYTSKMMVLFGDRRRKMNPIAGIFLNETNKNIQFLLQHEISTESQEEGTVKEGIDIYILKSEVEKLYKILNDVFYLIILKVGLVRPIRKPKDPTYTSDGHGLQIPITHQENRVKIDEIKAFYQTEGYVLNIVRTSVRDNEPSLNFEIEHKKNWYLPRLHIGLHQNWNENEDSSIIKSMISISLPWSEYGHLLSNIQGLLHKI